MNDNERLDGDETMIRRPTPGGLQPPPAPVRPIEAEPEALPTRRALNPLEQAAAPLLTLLVQIKNTPHHPNPLGLRSRLITEIKAFTTQAQQNGLSETMVNRARYVLCTALDEVVLNTPWGHASEWSEKGLLSHFHNETWGGEKFFRLKDYLIQDPAGNLPLLELMYLCLSFGFTGRYAPWDDGPARLEEERASLYRLIRAQRGIYERDLSPHWRGIRDRRQALIRYIPLWVIAAVVAAILLLLYLGLSALLNRYSDPVFLALSGIRGDRIAVVDRVLFTPPSMPAVPLPAAPDEPLFVAQSDPPAALSPLPDAIRTALAPEIAQHTVDVLSDGGQLTVRLLGDGLFDSGQITIKPAFQATLTRLAQSLADTPGPLIITGHTDSVPINTLRFPSNWHLSKARADAVSQRLRELGVRATLLSEGKADSEPVAPNDTPERRARNRRVEIAVSLRAAPPTTATVPASSVTRP